MVEDHLATAARVVLIDVHTGLGEYGAAVVFTEVAPDAPEYEWMMRCWEIPISNPSVGDASSPGIVGSLKGGFTRMLPGAEVIAGSLEFGTYPPLEVFWALRAENYIHHHGGWGHPDASEIKAELKRVFYPGQNDWMHSIWHQGSGVVSQKFVAFQSPTNGPRQGAVRRQWQALSKDGNAVLARLWGSRRARLCGPVALLPLLERGAAIPAQARLATGPHHHAES